MIKKCMKIQPIIVIICCLFLATSGIAAEKLGAYGIDKDSISVSGISSGGYMAHQFHVAHSKSVIGAGIIAGGPFFCSKGSIYNLCSCVNINNCFIAPADVHASIKATQKEAAHNRIDSPENMKTNRVWLFSGRKDTVIPTAVMDTVNKYYKAYLKEENIRYVINDHAAHAMISPNAKNECGYFGSPYMNNCNNYDAAGELLKWIYDDKLKKRGVANQNHLLEFGQTEFFDAVDDSISMNEVGHVYVPEDCV
ncbi:MAG: poly(3-hydroxybutyrate) depolymerase, partial [Syntrophaceae bacterium]|nr:poly(3-hydroxybutyrate) depolymerase [Syntrophaceae bacterium]